MTDQTRPAHHGPDGRFRIPWPLEVADQRSGGSIFRWQWERLTGGKRAPNPRPHMVPVVPHRIAQPRDAVIDPSVAAGTGCERRFGAAAPSG